METLEEEIMNNIFGILEYHTIQDKMYLLAVFNTHYFIYKGRLNGDDDEFDALVSAYETTLEYYKKHFSD